MQSFESNGDLSDSKKPERFIGDLKEYDSAHRVLQRLLKAGDPGVLAIRYYRVSESQNAGQLYSVDCVGHEDSKDFEDKFCGAVYWKEKKEPPRHDSFWAMRVNQTVLFRYVDKGGSSLKPVRSKHTSRIVPVPKARRQEDDVSQYKKSDIWIDIPLLVGGQSVGKLSCDLAEKVLIDRASEKEGKPESLSLAAAIEHPHTWEEIRYFAACAQAAAPFLDSLRNREFSKRLRAVVRTLYQQDIQDVQTLIDKTVAVVRSDDVLCCDHMDVLLRVRDTYKNDLLVLRNTTFVDGDSEVGKSSYNMKDPTGLTAWSADKIWPIRVRDLNDEDSLKKQLEDIAEARWQQLPSGMREVERDVAAPDWTQHIPLSYRHESLLVVPIVIGGKVEGIIRCADRKAGKGSARYVPFTERDQRLLTLACDQAIGPRLAFLRERHIADLVPRIVRNARSMTVKRFDLTRAKPSTTPRKSLARSLRQVLELVIDKLPAAPGNAKICFVNELEVSTKIDQIRSRQKFFLQVFGDESLAGIGKGKLPAKYSRLSKTLTLQSLRREEPVLVTDLVAAETANRYVPMIDKSIKSLCMMRVEYDGYAYGTIGIGSTGYDITESLYFTPIKVIADIAAAAYVRDSTMQRRERTYGIRHDVLPLVKQLIDTCDPTVLTPNEYLEYVIDAYTREETSDVSTISDECVDLDVKAMLQGAVDVIEFERGWQGRSVSISATDGLTARVHPSLVRAIMHNVLRNARQYSTERDSVDILASVTGEGMLEITVLSGEGSARHLKSVRAALSNSHLTDAATRGHGLQLVKWCVDNHRPYGREAGVVDVMKEGTRLGIFVALPEPLSSFG